MCDPLKFIEDIFLKTHLSYFPRKSSSTTSFKMKLPEMSTISPEGIGRFWSRRKAPSLGEYIDHRLVARPEPDNIFWTVSRWLVLAVKGVFQKFLLAELTNC